MFRRWLIRSLTLTLLTLCVTIWIGSAFQSVRAEGDGKTGSYMVEVGCGSIYFLKAPTGELLGLPWRLVRETPSYQSQNIWYENTKYHVIGFAYEPHSTPFFGWEVSIPLWFPTLLATLLLYLAWRKKDRPDPAGFPVEPVTSNDASSSSRPST